MPRVFLAIPLDDATRSAIESVTIPTDCPLRQIRPDELHVTLHFLGEVTDKKLTDLRALLRQLHAGHFTLSLRSAGFFGGNGRPEILWVGAEQHPTLIELHSVLAACLRSLDIAVEDRPYSPHLTIARLKSPSSGTAQTFVRTNQHFETAMPVHEFVLFSSSPNTGGCRYQIIESFPLEIP